MKMNESFAAFIISHGRPDNVVTYNTLRGCGYTGDIYIIVDNEDKTVNKYIENFGVDCVKIFDKKAYADQVDEMNNFDNRRTTTHARNACFDIARWLNIEYFIVLDDDYTSFEYRYNNEDNTKLLVLKIDNLDIILELYLMFYKTTNFLSIAFAQGGDFIGGVENPYVIYRPLMRKCMNSFICSIYRPFRFLGGLNEDVNTYLDLGKKGHLFGTIPMISLVQQQTQSNIGGMTDAYKLSGTFVKSFYSVMVNPSSVSVRMMNTSNAWIHHVIQWQNTVPMIINEKYKKPQLKPVNNSPLTLPEK